MTILADAAEITYDILQYLNYFFIALMSLGTIFQLFYIVFSFMKTKPIPVNEKKHKIAILISARNEETVIEKTVKALLEGQDYPKNRFDVFVIADNCLDQTAQRAKDAGAIVYLHDDPDPKTHKVSFALRYGIERIIRERRGEYDFLIRFDADNHAQKNFLARMNDAFGSGIEIARPYEASINGTQNAWTKVSATYYMRDSRLPSHVRESCRLDSMLTGAGMMVSMRVLEECENWDAMGLSEDAEFTLNRLIENKRIHYIPEAIVYEDQPSTAKDNWNRLTRMGHGLHSLFWRKGFKLFGHFFVSGRWSNVDLFNQLLFIPISIIACLWFPAYYVYFIVSHFLNAFGPNWLVFFSPEDSAAQLGELWQLIVLILAGYFLIYAFQTWLAVFLSKKKLGLKSLKGYWGGILLSPIFMIFYGLAITWGAITNPQWRPVNRNTRFHDGK